MSVNYDHTCGNTERGHRYYLGHQPDLPWSERHLYGNAYERRQTPTYQWTKNGTNISGETSVAYTGTADTDFVNGDLIRVVMTSTETCASPTTATSSPITMTVAASVTPKRDHRHHFGLQPDLPWS